MVVRNNEIGIALRGALQNPIIVRIDGHDLQSGSRRNDSRHLCDHSNSSLNPVLGPTEARAQYLGQLPNHRR